MSVKKVYISSATTAYIQNHLHTVSHKCMDINLTPSLVLLLFCVCITFCPAGVNAGSACTLCSGKDEGDAHTVVLSYLSELHSLEEIKILRLQLSSRFHNQQSHASHNPVQPKPNNNPPGSNSKNRCSLGHWCCPTNPHQSDQAEEKRSFDKPFEGNGDHCEEL